MSSWSLLVTVLPKRCGTVSWKLPLPAEKEWLGNYWGVIIFNGGRLAVAVLVGGLQRKKDGWRLCGPGGEGWEWDKSTCMCAVLKLECYLSYRPRQANGSAIRTQSLWRGQIYNIYTSLSLQNSLWTSAFTCETLNGWLCVYVVKKDRASLLTKCFQKSGNVATLQLLYLIIFLHSLLSCILPFLSHSFSCESCTHLLTTPLIISLSLLFSKRYLINYSLADFLHVMLRFPFGIILAVSTRTPTDQQTVAP